MINEIDNDSWYLISDIVKNTWIKTPRLKSNRQFVYEEIKKGKLKGHNILLGNTKSSYYKILGQDLIKYLNKFS